MLSRSVCYNAAQSAILGLFIDKPGEIYFSFRLGFFFENWEKRGYFGLEWGLISDPGDSKKRPWSDSL